MALIKQEVRVYQIFKVCPKCKDGSLAWTGEKKQLLVNGPEKYVHRCTNKKCNVTATYEKIFPHEHFEPMGQPLVLQEGPNDIIKPKTKQKQK